MPPLPDHVVWGRVKRIHIRDDLYLPNGRIDVGAVGAFGRLAGEYTHGQQHLHHSATRRTRRPTERTRVPSRLDGHSTDYSPIDTKEWSPSGSTKALAK